MITLSSTKKAGQKTHEDRLSVKDQVPNEIGLRIAK